MELFKTGATYGIAALVIIGGGVLLVIPTNVNAGELLPFLTGAIGTVLGYVFAERQTAQTQRGNGMERGLLQAMHRRLDTELPAVVRAASGATHAEHVEVEGETVNVSEGQPPHG